MLRCNCPHFNCIVLGFGGRRLVTGGQGPARAPVGGADIAVFRHHDGIGRGMRLGRHDGMAARV